MQLLWQEYILYSILDNVTVPLTRTAMLQYTLEDVPKGISLLYQVAAISSEGRKGVPSTTVAVSGMSQTLSQNRMQLVQILIYTTCSVATRSTTTELSVYGAC